MIRSVWNWIAGYRKIKICAEDRTKGINCLRNSPYIHWGLHTDTEGNLTFFLMEKDAVRFLEISKEMDIRADAEPLRGLPKYRRKYAGRWGIAVGIVLFFLIVRMSAAVVWSVEIRGNKNFSDREITEMLRESGFGEGTRYGNIDFELFQNDFSLQHPDIAWIAVNMLGNRAFVEVRENVRQNGEERSSAANVVAAEDGQIVEIRVTGGRAEAAPLQVVRKGELLISGIMSLRDAELRFERACGQVLAQVHRTICTEISFEQQTKSYTGEKKEEKSLLFFGKKLKLFQNGGFEGATYDTIIETVSLTLPGGIHLPIQLCTETHREFAIESFRLTEREACAHAEQKFGEAVAELLAEAEILSLHKEMVVEENCCRITGIAECIADIAEIREINYVTP